jgi:hypothetical protein
MAKIIYDNFLAGLSDSDRQGPAGSYYKGFQVTPHQNNRIGYILPQPIPTNATNVSAVADLVVDFEVEPNLSASYEMYGLGSAGHIYKMSYGPPITVSSSTFWPYHISAGLLGASGPAGVVGGDTITYPVGTTNYMFYSWENATSGSVGMFDWDVTFDDDYMTVSAANPIMLSAGYEHPMIQGDDGLLYIGNGNKLVSFDGQVGTAGTSDEQAIDLPVGWEITSLFKTGDYLGLAAWKKVRQSVLRTESSIFLWDYVSETYNKAIPTNDNKIVSTYNFNGDIILFTDQRNSPHMLRLIENGVENLGKLHFTNSTVDTFALSSPRRNSIDTFNNKMIFGVDGPYNAVYSYGQYKAGYPISLVNDYCLSGTGGKIGAIKSYFYDDILFSYKTADANYIATLGNTYSNEAHWAGLYTDINQKIRINYIKFYFKPLASGNSMTPTLDIDYGTSVPLVDARGNTTISFTNDGAVSSKKFNVKRDCHVFRPTITWTGGAPAVSKIIIDYTPMEDI